MFCFILSCFTNLSPHVEITLPNSEVQQSPLLTFSQQNVITQAGIWPGHSPTLWKNAKSSIMTKNAHELAFIPHSKLEFLQLIIPRTRRCCQLNIDSVLEKYCSVSEHHCFLQQVSSPGRSPIQILTWFSLAELQAGGLKHHMYVCVSCV